MKEPSLSEIEGGTPDSGIGIDNMDGKFVFYYDTMNSMNVAICMYLKYYDEN